MSAYGADLRRWKDRAYSPRGSEQVPVSLGFFDVLHLLWRHPALWATGFYRIGRWCSVHHVRVLPTLFERANLLWFGLEIGSGVPIGPGLYIAHPAGTVIFAKSIGANATFIHAVTVGMVETQHFPVIGDAVFVGAGARILGPIRVGNRSKVGAGAVVMDSVPDGATVVGVPAHVVRKTNGETVPGRLEVL